MSLLLAIGGGTAFAQGAPSERGYDESLGVIGEIETEQPQRPQEQEAAPTPTPTAAPTPVQQEEGGLPFTGMDLGIVAVMGTILLGTGLVLRRTTRRAPTA